MYEKVNNLFDIVKSRESKKVFKYKFERISKAKKNVLAFSNVTIDALMGDESAKERWNSLLKDTINSLNYLNDLSEKYNNEKIFYFDENDAKDVFRISSEYNDSIGDYISEHWEG